MDQVSKERTQDVIAKAENVTVAVSQTAGFDGLASGLAIYLSCIKLNKNISILAKPPTVSDALLLYGIDKIGKSEGSRNLVIVVDDAVKRVDKVTYFLEDDKLKIVVHPFQGSAGVSREQIRFEEALPNPDLVFAVGMSSKEELIKMITHEHNLDSKVWTVNVNRKQLEKNFAQANAFNPDAVSFSEVTGQLLQELNLPVDGDIAFNLYSGISHATANFSPAKTSQLSFQIAAWLVRFGAGRASLAAEPLKGIFESPEADAVKNQKTGDISSVWIPTTMVQNSVGQSPLPKVDVETGETRPAISQADWLKPPKIYHGSKSFGKVE